MKRTLEGGVVCSSSGIIGSQPFQGATRQPTSAGQEPTRSSAQPSYTWPVVYSCRTGGKWVTSKRKTILSIAPSSDASGVNLTVKLPGDASTKLVVCLLNGFSISQFVFTMFFVSILHGTDLLCRCLQENMILSSSDSADKCVAIAKNTMHFKVSLLRNDMCLPYSELASMGRQIGEREFLIRFNDTLAISECHNHVKDHITVKDSMKRCCGSPSEAQFENSQMDLDDIVRTNNPSMTEPLLTRRNSDTMLSR